MSQDDKKLPGSSSDVHVQGPPLRPRHNPRSRRTRRRIVESSDIPGPSVLLSPFHRTYNEVDHPEVKQEEPYTDRQPSSSEQTSTDTAPIEPPIEQTQQPPSPPLLLSYLPEDEPELIARMYIQKLQVIHITREARTPCPIPLCPFIVAHIRPFVIPHFPLHIPSMYGYVFYLLHILKETITSPSAPTMISYIAVFSMTNLETKTHFTLGTSITEQHVEQIQRNIQEEITHLKERILEYGNKRASNGH
jgi:hypothetical protein